MRGFSRFAYYSSLYFVGATRDGHMLRGHIYKHTYTQIEFKSTCNLGGPGHEHFKRGALSIDFSAFHSSEHAIKVDRSFHLRVVSLASRSLPFYAVPLRALRTYMLRSLSHGTKSAIRMYIPALKIKKVSFSPKVSIQPCRPKSVQPFLEPFEHNLGPKSSNKRLLQPTLGPISALGTKAALALANCISPGLRAPN